ncbi:tetratricopeptide repeat protein [Actinoplanes aureus]|uniref:Tetratricopeptide repeat protein n=1 Tax=Actinoplanes aureus TaxID=2792083 RepID=A0A931CBR9_9ACTN|nr:tetratricopeptide repeat protein [Actinoplanes aureus]MBG0567020.1 tetratricopeptide repeat protein [Actinoplanes aureus]
MTSQLATQQELVEFYREAARSDPAQQLNLGDALQDLADMLADLGRTGDALEVVREAIAVRRVAIGPDRPETIRLVGSLHQGVHFAAETGHASESDAYFDEATGLLCRLTTLPALEVMPHVAGSWVQQAGGLMSLGRLRAAESFGRAAVAAGERIPPTAPIAQRAAALGPALNGLASVLYAQERAGEALDLLQEAEKLCRELVAVDRTEGLKGLTAVLRNEGVIFMECGRLEDAYRCAQELERLSGTGTAPS